MRRRDFVTASLATTAATALAGLERADGAPVAYGPPQQFYELRSYNVKPDADHKLVEEYLEKAAILAWNRLGVNPVGVFTELNKPQVERIDVLLPYNSLETFLNATVRVAGDTEYQQAAAAYLAVTPQAPAFVRMESALMLAFTGLPKLVLPPYSVAKQPRIFELRTYESHNERAALKKIEMFNAGEIGAMQRSGMAPVFYGQTLIGPRLPNLTYLLSAPDMDSHKQHWAAFGGDPEWKRLRAIPEYNDAAIVSKISSTYLQPTAYSQI